MAGTPVTGPGRDRRAAERAGRWAEGLAAITLLLRGYRIVARRFRSGEGEIDLVARRGRTLVFVEVKARPTHEEARLAVTPSGQARICRAASIWLARLPGAGRDMAVRYDIVTVAGRSVRHVRDAFRPPGPTGADGAGLF